MAIRAKEASEANNTDLKCIWGESNLVEKRKHLLVATFSGFGERDSL